MFGYIYICMYVYMYVHIHVYMCILYRRNIDACTFIYSLHAYMQLHIYMCIHVNSIFYCVYMYILAYPCICIFVIYIHTM